MKITIDHTRCEANELCVMAAPDTFNLNDDETLELVGSDAFDALDADQQSAVEDAIASCPRHALSLQK